MKKKAFSLLECMVTLVLLLMTVGAVMSFRCYTVTAAERAEDQLMAAHTAYLLAEAWKCSKGDPSFNPTERSYADGFVVETDPSAEGVELAGFSGNYAGSWRVLVGGKQYGAHLYYEDYAGVDNMRQIHVIMTWQDARAKIRQFHLPTLAKTI